MCAVVVGLVALAVIPLSLPLYDQYLEAWESQRPPAGSYYETLGGLSTSATEKEVHEAYRRALRTLHPDKAGPQADPEAAQQRFLAVQQARDALTTPFRCGYDFGLGLGGLDRYERLQACKARFARKPPRVQTRKEFRAAWDARTRVWDAKIEKMEEEMRTMRERRRQRAMENNKSVAKRLWPW